MSLTAREEAVLSTVIEDYIAGAAPVGSRTVAKKGSLGLSPASIRNVMSDLTDKGYLEQPHTSAGRVPTLRAFRHYLDSIMRERPLTLPEQAVISNCLGEAGLEVGDLLRQASRILSDFSRHMSLVVAPRHLSVRWKRIDFALLGPGLVMAVLVLQGGLMQKRLIEVSGDISWDELTAYSNYLNHLFGEMTFGEVRAKLFDELNRTKAELDSLYLSALSLALEAMREETEPEVYLEGAANIFAHPETSDMGSLRELLGVFEQRTKLLELFDKTVEEFRTMVVLGSESNLGEMSGCGVISSPYGPREHPLGAISVVGPIRMDYAKLVPAVSFTAKVLTNLLGRHF